MKQKQNGRLHCNKITYMYVSSAKEMWENINYLTTYQNKSVGGVLLLFFTKMERQYLIKKRSVQF